VSASIHDALNGVNGYDLALTYDTSVLRWQGIAGTADPSLPGCVLVAVGSACWNDATGLMSLAVDTSGLTLPVIDIEIFDLLFDILPTAKPGSTKVQLGGQYFDALSNALPYNVSFDVQVLEAIHSVPTPGSGWLTLTALLALAASRRRG
jgi:MYXO-CTERM domain-containing protein